ncbi:MAG TPA: DUF3592 domain-containing protein [Phycisphaerae bacterium]|nr:DUF3592 domain-containing protein [Phycisphaerae bacterium]
MSKGDTPEQELVGDQPEARPPDIAGGVRRAFGRVGAVLGGLLFTLIATVFIVAGIAMTAASVHTARTYKPIGAIVTEVEGGSDEHDFVRVTSRYTVEGTDYDKTIRAGEDDSEYDALRRMAIGAKLTVWYDPSDPGQSQRNVRVTAMPLTFSMFALPFLAIGLSQVVSALRGRGLWAPRSPSRRIRIPGGWLFLVFAGLCCLGGFALAAAAVFVAFPLDLVVILAYAVGVIPLVMWGAAGLMRRRSARRRATQPIARGRPETDKAPAVLGEKKELSLSKSMGLAIGMTLFWCGMTGALGYFCAARPILSSRAAAGWRTAEGAALVSKVKTHQGDDSDTYSPYVRYRYTVGGKKYVNDRYDFMGGSSSDRDHARRVVKAHPRGRKVTVYYDPANPAEAVLFRGVPAMTYVLMVFIQPFLLVGLGMIVWTATLPSTHGHLRRFLAAPAALPWRIPRWGTLRQDLNGPAIRRRGRLGGAIKSFAMGYGLVCFVSIFVIVFWLGPGNATPKTLKIVVCAALVAGAAAATSGLLKRGRYLVRFDQPQRLLTVRSARRDEQARFDEIATWRIRRVRYAGGAKVSGRRERCLLLEAVTADGRAVPVHAFRFGSAGGASRTESVARKVQQAFAELTGSEARKTLVRSSTDDEAIEEPRNPAQAVEAAAKVVKAWRKRDGYSDLS